MFFDKDGAKHAANYQAVKNGIDNAHELDKTDKRNRVAKTNARWEKAKVTLLMFIFTSFGIDSNTGHGNYDKEKAEILRSLISTNEDLTRYLVFKLKLNVSSALPDVAFINKIP